MRVYEYSRVSTVNQTLSQQQNTVSQYLAEKGMKVYKTVTDEGVSGGVSYKQRNLAKLLDMMQEGDILIVSEISRLGRSISDVNKLVNDELKPRKLRLIIVKMNIDLDCSNIKAIDEMILFAFSFSAQVEKEMIQQRVASKLDSIKHELKSEGSHITERGKNKGRIVTKLGSDTWTQEQMCRAGRASAEKKQEAARSNPANLFLWRFIQNYEKSHGVIYGRKKVESVVEELNFLGAKTSTGMDFTVARYYSMQKKVRTIFTNI